jgi:osmotically-inducible protein OsmY
MGNLKVLAATAALSCAFVGCARTTQSPDVAKPIRQSLDQAGFKNVSVSQDRDKGVVTLAGHVPADSDKAEADSIAKSSAAGEVVANEIEVVSPDNHSDARTVNSDLDRGIKNNLDAALLQDKLDKGFEYNVKNGVVKLTGEVNSPSRRAEVGKVASGVPNVVQVVNEIQIRNQKATSSN